jgi:hypothetical protein
MISQVCDLSQFPQVSSILTRRGDVVPVARLYMGTLPGLGQALHALSLCSYLDRTGAWGARIAQVRLGLLRMVP